MQKKQTKKKHREREAQLQKNDLHFFAQLDISNVTFEV